MVFGPSTCATSCWVELTNETTSFGRKKARKASETSVTHVAGLVLPIFPVAQFAVYKMHAFYLREARHVWMVVRRRCKYAYHQSVR